MEKASVIIKIEFTTSKTRLNSFERHDTLMVYNWDYNVALSTNERFYFCLRENDSREVSGLGWWRATGRVKKVYANYNNQTLVGFKRPLTFHRFSRDEPHDPRTKRNKAIKTNWIMHEYSLESYTTVCTIISLHSFFLI
ncbi:NAC domain-containing protein [Citrus sinensis]|nr:NAC domain-containing protein [Citrus sinensis]